jgi:glucose/arabinose dehydrogenase
VVKGLALPSRFSRGALATLVAFACLIWSAAALAPAAEAAIPPPGFVVEPVLSGLNVPVAIDFASGGRMFVAEKSGVVRVFKNGVLLPTPFINLSADVNDYHEHGLLGMTLHPDFPAKPYVYVLYTYDPPGVAKDQPGGRVARLERITANPGNPDVAASGSGARTVLLGRNADATAITEPNSSDPSLTCWRSGARVEDCIPQDSRRHAVGTLTFGPDGNLYFSNGDSDRLPGGPQDPATHVGTIMRINPETGGGLPDNPFYNGNPASNISKTWAYGLKNPFRFSFDPVSGQMFIADVGAQSWEAIHLGQAGKNYGWPCYEGGSHVFGTYQNTSLCKSVYAQGPRPPLHTYQQTAAGASVTGGDWYYGNDYPAPYRGAYFFADYAQGWVKLLRPSGSGGYTASPFLDDGGEGGTTSGIVQLISGPNGDLHWVSINNGTVYRLRYGGASAAPFDLMALDFEKRRGKVAVDSSGSGNGAKLRKGASLGRGQLGRNLKLDGVNDFASVSSSPTLSSFGDEITVAGWVKRTAKQASWRMLVSRQLGTGPADQFFLGFKDGAPRFGVSTSNGGEKSVGAGGAPRKKWVHIAGVYDGSRMTLYVNGVARATLSKSGNIVSSTRPVLVGANANGRRPLAATQNLNGQLDEVRLHSQALSAAEIRTLAVKPPHVEITRPKGDTTARLGARVRFAARAEDPGDGNLTSQIVWDGVLHHTGHTHPDVLAPTTGRRGSFVLEDHADDTFVELCAKVTNRGGRTDEDCVDIRPRTTRVTIRSVPAGRVVSFADLNRATPYTTRANVGAFRTLSAPLVAGCFAFKSWSDGGVATHRIKVPAGSPTYTARFRNTCG